MKIAFYVLFVCTIIGLSGCSTQRFNVSNHPIKTETPTYEGTSHFWLLKQEDTLNPGNACGEGGINYIETKETFVDGLFSFLSCGLYTPRTYAVYCNSPYFSR